MEYLLHKIMAHVKADEGFVPHVYQDSEGFWTIGYGTLVDKRRGGGIDEIEAEYLARNRIIKVLAPLSMQPFWKLCSEDQQAALASMAYNLGYAGFMGFKKMVAALNTGDWERAADEMLDSDAARELPNRYGRLAAALRAG